jgi:hypothetical protein
VVLPVVFPLVGQTRVRDTYNAPRGGGTRVHQGVDLPLLARRAAPNTVYPVRASTDGEIVRVSHEGPRGHPNQGNAVFIKDDDGWTHLYAHLQDAPPEAFVGQRVSAGAVIGVAGNTGNARNTGPHLHYHIVDERGQRVNPTQRLMLLHAALESAGLDAARERRVSRPSERRMPSLPSMHGVGDDGEHEPLLVDERPGAGPRVAPRATAATPAPRAQAPRPRNESREAIEQARLAYRGALPLVEREAVAVTETNVWDALRTLLEPEEMRGAAASRQLLVPIIWQHLEQAALRAQEAETNPLMWIEALQLLLAAHRLIGTLSSSFERLRERASGTPLMPAFEALALANAVTERAMRTYEAVPAIAQEVFDDVAEEASNIAMGFGFGAALLIGYGLYTISQSVRR